MGFHPLPHASPQIHVAIARLVDTRLDVSGLTVQAPVLAGGREDVRIGGDRLA